MTVGVSHDVEGGVLVRDMVGGSIWRFAPAAARDVADECLAIAAVGKPDARLKLEDEDGDAFIYVGGGDHFLQFAGDLKKHADAAAKWAGATGHA